MSKEIVNRLDTESVGKSLVRYLIPSMVGMLLMGLNVVADGIMVGHSLGSVALAGVGIATPVYTSFVAMSLWIGIGAATKYSAAMGAKEFDKARIIFSHAMISIFIFTVIIGVLSYTFRTELAFFLGANAETLPFVTDYMNILLLFGFVFTVENAFSIMVRNDGAPNLAMVALIATAVVNIVLNYVFLFVLDYGIAGSAAATIIGAFVGLVILSTHFFKKQSNLRLVRFSFNKKLFLGIMIIGFPSFLSEVGFSVFTLSHNLIFEKLLGTIGVSAFTILNYIHTLMLLLFLGMGAAIQPLVSYYKGARNQEKVKKTVNLAIIIAVSAGVFFFLLGQFAAKPITSVFGDFSQDVLDIAIPGIKLFFIAYLFMGTNFVMMTYYQSIGQIRMATWITAAREIVLLLILLMILPPLLGVTGVWLAIPTSEILVLLSIVYYQKKWQDL